MLPTDTLPVSGSPNQDVQTGAGYAQNQKSPQKSHKNLPYIFYIYSLNKGDKLWLL